MIVNLINVPEAMKLLLNNLGTKDLYRLSLVNKSLNQVIKYQLIKRLVLQFDNFHNALNEVYSFRKKEIPSLSRNIYRIPKNMEIKVKEGVTKINLKELPKQFLQLQWQPCSIDEAIDQEHQLYSQANKAFKQNGQFLIMNRSLIDPSLNIIMPDINEDGSKEVLEQIAISNEFHSNDLVDMQSILNRQRQILAKIDNNKQKVEKQNKDTQEANVEALKKISKYAIILCHGGYFALGIYENNICIHHKSDHRYVVRGKAGKRQINKDSSAGSNIQSIGSQIRRDQEKKHQEKVNSILTECFALLQSCQLILLQAPGINYQLLIQNEEPLKKLQDKIRSICLTAKKANHTEVERVHKAITSVYLVKQQEQLFF